MLSLINFYGLSPTQKYFNDEYFQTTIHMYVGQLTYYDCITVQQKYCRI